MRFDLSDRLVAFGVTVGQIARELPADRLANHVAGQLVRSGTAPAAHHAEAQAAESRRDFVHKLKVGLKELRESAIWLRMVRRMGQAPPGTDAAERECDELIAILATSIATATRNGQQRNPRPIVKGPIVKGRP